MKLNKDGIAGFANRYAKYILFLPGMVLFLSVVLLPLAFNYYLMFMRWDPSNRSEDIFRWLG